jgi:very-short-patch-repair endonuclease
VLPFDVQCRAVGLIPPVGEHRFHPVRRWRFDWAWPAHKIALEVEGGVFIQGRHSRGVGMVKDMEKYNSAAELGWRIVRVTPKQIVNGEALQAIEKVLR